MILDQDWLPWQKEAQEYSANPSFIGVADLDSICRVLTTHARADRFCENHFDLVLRSGVITKLLLRLKELRAVNQT
jgi:hypothetical protein